MKVLVIGGSRFLGGKLMEELVYGGNEVASFDLSPPPEKVVEAVQYFAGDKASLGFFQDELLGFQPDVVVHLTLNTTEDAAAFLDTFDGKVSHLVVASNTNVYLAHGRLRQTEPGPSLAVPIKEDSKLRTSALKEDGPGDKLLVEKSLQRAKTPLTLLRFGPIYGPEDYLRRFYPLMIRMIDERPHLLLSSAQAGWKWSHVYVDDAAHALFLAASGEPNGKRVFNVAERSTPTMKERVEHIGTVFGWEGRVGVLPEDQLPPYLRVPGDFAQDMEIDSSLIRSELQYREVTDYYDGLLAAVEWYRDNPPPELAGKTFNYEAEDSVSSMAFERNILETDV